MLRGRLGAAVAPIVLSLVVAAQLAIAPAHAALFDDDEARKRIELLKSRVDQLETSLSGRLGALEATVKSQGLVELLHDVEQIKADIAKLRGQYEVLTYELEQAQKRQRDLYLDLDGRLRKLEGGAGAAAPAATGPPAADSAPAAGPGASSAGAPARPLAASALYWAGNAQYALKDFRSAIATQRQLMAMYPDSQKVPDAMLNIASCLTELRDAAGARRTLEELVAKYPASEAGGKARQRLSAR